MFGMMCKQCGKGQMMKEKEMGTNDFGTVKMKYKCSRCGHEMIKKEMA